jgi:ectoine hydroxylase-related dioxygenase (phytanoyl-CoA dioxygenase family)
MGRFSELEKLRIETDFESAGFAKVENLVSADAVAELVAAYDSIIEGRVSCGEFDRNLGGLTRQVMMPHLCHPAFAENEAIRNAQEIAGGLIKKPCAELFFSMLIFKPPGHPHETPWHQDMAYSGKPFTAAGSRLPNHAVAQFWLALNDVDEEMGCMEFIPGVQNQPMPEHLVASGKPDDEGRLLAMAHPSRDLDLTRAVKCPLKAGSATVHGYATPHYTGPNRSQTSGRRAFIFSFANLDAFSSIANQRGEWSQRPQPAGAP